MAIRLSAAAKAIGLALYAVAIDLNKSEEQRYNFVLKSDAGVAALDKAGLVFFNDTLRNDKGETAAVLSPAGKEHFKPLHEKANKPAGEGAPRTRGAAIDPAALTIRTDVAMPEASARGGPRGNSWPWENFPINGSVFIAATDDRKEPHKSLASTVNTANRKFAAAFEAAKAANDPAALAPGAVPRKFRIAETTEGGVKGAIIGRVA